MLKRFLFLTMTLLLFSSCMQSNRLSLAIYSSPSGASIYQNGAYMGQAPMSLEYSITPQFYSYGSMPIEDLYAVWKSGAKSDLVVNTLFSHHSAYQEVTFRRPENHPDLQADVDYANELESASQRQQQIKEEEDLQRLQRVNDYLQNLPGGSNYQQPRSCPYLSAQTSDMLNTYCIYECTDGTTKTVTQIKGWSCI